MKGEKKGTEKGRGGKFGRRDMRKKEREKMNNRRRREG